MIKKFNTVHELLQETLREFIYIERMNSSNPYAAVAYVCHVMKDCSDRSDTSYRVYRETSDFIYDSMKGERVFVSYLRTTDSVFVEIDNRRNTDYINLLESQQAWREYLVKAKIRWLENLIYQAKKEGL